MKYRRSRLAALVIACTFLLLPLTACEGGKTNKPASQEEVQRTSCKFEDNFNETADSFISRCRKAGIRGEFPTEYYPVTLGEIDRDRSRRGRKARKLLTRRRWIK